MLQLNNETCLGVLNSTSLAAIIDYCSDYKFYYEFTNLSGKKRSYS